MTDADAAPRADRARSASGRRAATARRQHLRRRRAAVLGVALLLGGTAVARALESPSDLHASGAAQLAAYKAGAQAAAVAAPGAEGGSSSVPATASSPSPSSASAPPSVSSSLTPTSSATTSPTATPHADGDGGADPAPDTTSMSVPMAGKGTLVAMAIPAGPLATTGRAVRYSVEVEAGLPVSSAEFAATVRSVLADRRGWQTKDGVRFVPVSPAQLAAGAAVDIRVTLASPSLTAKLCAPLNVTIQQVSCWNGSRSVLNLTRWMHGSVTYGADLKAYRTYLISHEVGHGLGHGHVSCPGPGRPAPVMVQQTKSLEGCTASPWPTGG